MALRRRAFTLVEVLIAVTMFSVLFVGLGAQLRGGFLIWRRSTQTVEVLQRQRIGWDRLERDLANAVAYGAAEGAPSTEGSTALAAFQADGLRWVTRASRGAPMAPLRLVTYTCGAEGFQRRSQSLSDARAGVAAPPEPLGLPDCEALAVRYAYQVPGDGAGVEWRSVWDDAVRLPRLVEVTLHLQEAGESAQVLGVEALRRVLPIPSGVLKPADTEGAS